MNRGPLYITRVEKATFDVLLKHTLKMSTLRRWARKHMYMARADLQNFFEVAALGFICWGTGWNLTINVILAWLLISFALHISLFHAFKFAIKVLRKITSAAVLSGRPIVFLDTRQR